MSDVRPYMTDCATFHEAVTTYLDIEERRWFEENPRPHEAKFIQAWFMKKLRDLYPDYQFLIDGREVSVDEALKLNISTWNHKLTLAYDEELGDAIEKEKHNEG